MKGTVHCDSCGHDIKEQDVAVWHLKPCPKCNAAPMVSDEDLELANAIDALIELGLATQGKTKKPHLSFKINTAGLRKKEAA